MNKVIEFEGAEITINLESEDCLDIECSEDYPISIDVCNSKNFSNSELVKTFLSQINNYIENGNLDDLFSDNDFEEPSADFYVVVKKTDEEFDFSIETFTDKDISDLVEFSLNMDSEKIASFGRIAVDNDLF